MVCVIIAAAGQGKRMGGSVNKILLPLRGKPVLAHTVLAACQAKNVTSLILTAAPEETEIISKLIARLKLDIAWQVVAGGSERQYSIANALQAVPAEANIVVVHDGARPLAQAALFEQVVDAAGEDQAAIVGVPVKDTIKATNADGWVTDTPDRRTLWSIQTPQAFDRNLLMSAYHQAAQEGYLGTDDAALVERTGTKVKIVFGDYQNIKITTPEDLQFAETILGRRQEDNTMIRVGIGYDVHRLVPERKLILGGVDIPYTLGLDGHSDADVLLHAIKDALLGAAALGDIGRHFPDTDGRFKGISSLTLLAEVREILSKHGYAVNNIDATIVAQKPKLASYIAQMNTNIATALGVDENQINVKATTTEGLGFAGQGQGMAAYATAAIVKLEG